MSTAYSYSESSRAGLHIILWGTQATLALIFGLAGFLHVTGHMGELEEWVPQLGSRSRELFLFVGVSELLGAAGLILPSMTRILPGLTPLAALGLLWIMVLAAVLQLAQDPFALPVNLLLGGAAAFVAWGRLVACPIPSARPG